MKKFLLIFLVGQMLVCSFIYVQSFYDIYFLNNMGVRHYNAYYVEEANGENLGQLYNELLARNISVEIIKEPVSMDGMQKYEVYDTKDISVSPLKPLSKEKEIKYLTLGKEDFIDSTGTFKTNASSKQLRDIAQKLGITISPVKNDKVSYMQVAKNNAVNLLILLLISQFILLAYTISRMKVNAIKKLNGFSSGRMIVDSFSKFIPMEFIAFGVTFLFHFSYCMLNKNVSRDYFIGLLITFCVVGIMNIIQLMFTQFSIRSIDINAVIKNHIYSPTMNNAIHVIKIVFILVVTISISILSHQLKNYNASVHTINKYRVLSKYFTSNGFNSDEYDKVFSDHNHIEHLAKNVKSLYREYDNQALLVDANMTSITNDAYYQMHQTSFEKLNDSYTDNYVVVNENYYERYMNFVGVNGKKLSLPKDQAVILVPEKYKGDKDVEAFCHEQYNAMMNYDNYYLGKAEQDHHDFQIIYIQDHQITPLLNEYLLETGKEIRNAIVFIDHRQFAGTWYLSEISNGKLAFELKDRDAYKMLLKKYDLNNLLLAGTILTPLSDDIRYYEFLVYQSFVFVALFVITLIMIIFFSNYLEIMVNRKRYALKYLMGFSRIKSMKYQLIIEMIILVLAIPLFLLQQNILIIFVSVFLDFVLLFIMFNKLILWNISEIMKGE